MSKLSLRYYDSKMNAVYSLEELRAQHQLDPLQKKSFEEWINEMVESEVLIPID